MRNVIGVNFSGVKRIIVVYTMYGWGLKIFIALAERSLIGTGFAFISFIRYGPLQIRRNDFMVIKNNMDGIVLMIIAEIVSVKH